MCVWTPNGAEQAKLLLNSLVPLVKRSTIGEQLPYEREILVIDVLCVVRSPNPVSSTAVLSGPCNKPFARQTNKLEKLGVMYMNETLK